MKEGDYLPNIARKIRIYPDDEQSIIINNTFNVCRFIWNQMLEESIKSFDNGKLMIPNYGDIVLQNSWMSKDNKEYRFDRHAASNTKLFLRSAFDRYRDKAKKSNNKKGDTKKRKDGREKGFPRFKARKYCKNSYTNYNAWCSCHIDNDNHLIKIPCLGWVKYNPREKNISDDWKIKHITISKSNTGKYYCSICFEYSIDIEYILKNKDKNNNIIGLDYSSSSLYVDSEGNKGNYPKYYRSSQQRLRLLQQKFSRQRKGGKNRENTLNKIRILHEKISNQRKDFLHKLSTSITKKFRIICVEDINMRDMSQCLRLGKSTMDNGFGMFREMLSYKQDRIPYHELIRVNQWIFPSSKRCSKCGHVKSELKLKDRIYECNECGKVIDRDINAATNLKQYAFHQINGLKILCWK